ncbi:MAG: lipoate--protein ligase family protein [Hyphomicrobiaceae bacterium]
MTVSFRVIDSGVAEGRQQIAFDQALVELHSEGTVPDSLRFLRFPPTVLVGRHQVLSHEIKVKHCRDNGIGIVRRITGGGAIYLDENQVGWELVFDRRNLPMNDLVAYTQTICEAVADGLSTAFGIDARFRPRNDIEVEGQKLCGTGGFFDGNTLIYQGTVLVDVDPAAMMACLNVPEAKLAKRQLDKAENRVTTLKALLGTAPAVDDVHCAIISGLETNLGIACTPQSVGIDEDERAIEIYREEIGTDAFVYGTDSPDAPDVLSSGRTTPGGTLTAYARLDGPSGAPRIREILLTGDFFITPPRTVLDLEASLRGVAVADAGEHVTNFFEQADVGMVSLSVDDFRSVIAETVQAIEPA